MTASFLEDLLRMERWYHSTVRSKWWHLRLAHCNRICHARWKSRTKDTASHNDLSSSNRDSSLFWTNSFGRVPKIFTPGGFHTSGPDSAILGEREGALSGIVPGAVFSFSWSWIPAIVCNLSTNRSWKTLVRSSFETTCTSKVRTRSLPPADADAPQRERRRLQG